MTFSTIGAFVDDPRYALGFRYRLPQPVQPSRLVVLLHGVGSNEENLAALALAVPDDALVVLVRAPLKLATGQFGWFSVSFTADGPRIVASEAEASRVVLLELIGQLQREHGIEARDTTVAGFSQGGILSASAALSDPSRVQNFAILSGRILPELEPQLASREALSNVRSFIGHGVHDQKLPVDWAGRASALLDQLGVKHTLRTYPIGHELGAAMRDDFLAWLTARQ